MNLQWSPGHLQTCYPTASILMYWITGTIMLGPWRVIWGELISKHHSPLEFQSAQRCAECNVSLHWLPTQRDSADLVRYSGKLCIVTASLQYQVLRSFLQKQFLRLCCPQNQPARGVTRYWNFTLTLWKKLNRQPESWLHPKEAFLVIHTKVSSMLSGNLNRKLYFWVIFHIK